MRREGTSGLRRAPWANGLLLLWGSLICGLALAAPAVPTHCGAIAEPSARLACFDAWLAGVVEPEALKSPQVTLPAAPDEAIAEQTIDLEQSFGSEALTETRRSQRKAQTAIAEIESAVQQVSRGPRGRFTFTLENAQVWRQASPRVVSIRAGDSVTIRRSRTGRYTMATAGGAITKVSRVR